LLHDIGTGDGIAQGVAAPERFAHQHSGAFFHGRSHDGSAATFEEAIGRHANEAELARRSERAAESDRGAPSRSSGLSEMDSKQKPLTNARSSSDLRVRVWF
jgi:hypothetical protein